jgi:hypothetical protein
MTDLFDDRAVPLHVQIEAARREAQIRRKVYPGWVERGRMKQVDADREIAAMEAIVETLKGLAP